VSNKEFDVIKWFYWMFWYLCSGVGGAGEKQRIWWDGERVCNAEKDALVSIESTCNRVSEQLNSKEYIFQEI